MLGVDDAAAKAAWYHRALGATEPWSLGSVRGLLIDGAPFFLHDRRTDSPARPTSVLPRRASRYSSTTPTRLCAGQWTPAPTARPIRYETTARPGASTDREVSAT